MFGVRFSPPYATFYPRLFSQIGFILIPLCQISRRSRSLFQNYLQDLTMKRIIIIDGGPRKNMNTAKLLQSFAEGAKSVGGDIEVKTVRLYDIDYRGCMACMACKVKGKASNICCFKDALAPVLEDIAQADGLVLGSPIYFGEGTGQMRACLERLAFPWLSYNDYSLNGSQAYARGARRDDERYA